MYIELRKGWSNRLLVRWEGTVRELFSSDKYSMSCCAEFYELRRGQRNRFLNEDQLLENSINAPPWNHRDNSVVEDILELRVKRSFRYFYVAADIWLWMNRQHIKVL